MSLPSKVINASSTEILSMTLNAFPVPVSERERQPMHVVFLSSPLVRTREREHYARAFQRAGHHVTEWLPRSLSGEGLSQLLTSISAPVLVLQPEQEPTLPSGLNEVVAATACFQIDTFTYTRRRIQWSMAYDHAFVFHPGFESLFESCGHSSTILLPHAVDSGFARHMADGERHYDLAWVGRIDGSKYARRRQLLPRLSNRFVMNDWQRRHSEEEVSQVYGSAKIVVNISRDDWPQDANLRVFEAMAAGALLVTSLPTELTKLGFVEGEDFLGYTHYSDVCELVDTMLKDEPKRIAIASTGQSLVLSEHTYDRRVEKIIEVTQTRNVPRSRLDRHQFEILQLDYCIGQRAWTEGIVIGLKLLFRYPHSVILVALAALRRRFIPSRLQSDR